MVHPVLRVFVLVPACDFSLFRTSIPVVCSLLPFPEAVRRILVFTISKCTGAQGWYIQSKYFGHKKPVGVTLQSSRYRQCDVGLALNSQSERLVMKQLGK